MTMIAKVSCRHCNAVMIRIRKKQVSPDNTRLHIVFRCKNEECGYIEKWEMKPISFLSPPAILSEIAAKIKPSSRIKFVNKSA